MPKNKNKWALEDIQSFRGQELEEEETAAAAPIPLPKIPQVDLPPPVGPITKAPVIPKPTTKAVEPPEIYDTLEGWEDSLRRMNMQPPVEDAAPTGQPSGVPPVTAVPPEFVRDTIATTKYVDQVHQSLVNLFPEEDDVTLDSVIAFANAMPNEFLGVLRDLGRSPDAENILKSVLPDISPDAFWGEFPIPTPQKKLSVQDRQALLYTELGYDPAPPVKNPKERQERVLAFQAYRRSGGKLSADQWERYGMPPTLAEEMPTLSPEQRQTIINKEAEKQGNLIDVFAQSLKYIPPELGAGILTSVVGEHGMGASVVDKDWAHNFIKDVSTNRSKFISEVRAKYGESDLPISLEDVATLPQNVAFSLTSMGAGLAAGAPLALIPAPGSRVAAWAVGTVASGAVAYNMASYQIMQQYLEAMDAEMVQRTGSGITKQEEDALKQSFQSLAMQYGLWEAVPEALSNLAFTRILTMPLNKMVGKTIAAKIISKIVGMYGEEFLTETITQKGQSDIEVAAGLRENRISWVEAFKEVAPQTFLLTTVLGGAGQVTVSSISKIKASLKKEAGDSQVFAEINENIKEGVFDEVEAEASTWIDKAKGKLAGIKVTISGEEGAIIPGAEPGRPKLTDAELLEQAAKGAAPGPNIATPEENVWARAEYTKRIKPYNDKAMQELAKLEADFRAGINRENYSKQSDVILKPFHKAQDKIKAALTKEVLARRAAKGVPGTRDIIKSSTRTVNIAEELAAQQAQLASASPVDKAFLNESIKDLKKAQGMGKQTYQAVVDVPAGYNRLDIGEDTYFVKKSISSNEAYRQIKAGLGEQASKGVPEGEIATKPIATTGEKVAIGEAKSVPEKGKPTSPELAALKEGTTAQYLDDLRTLGYSETNAQSALKELVPSELDAVTAPLRHAREAEATAAVSERLYGPSDVSRLLRENAAIIRKRAAPEKGIAPGVTQARPLTMQEAIALGEKEQIGRTFKEVVEAPKITPASEWLSRFDPKTSARYKDVLGKSRMINGKPSTQAKYIEDSVAAGAIVTTRKNGRRVIQHPDGRFMYESDLSKVALDYAESLIEKAKIPAPEVAQAKAGITQAPLAKVEGAEAIGKGAAQPGVAGETVETIEATVDALEKKWSTTKARNSTRAAADLDALEAKGYDVEEARDALLEYKDTVRADFDTAEEFSEARAETWDEFVNAIGAITKEVEEVGAEEITAPEVTGKGEAPKAAEGAAPAPPAVEAAAEAPPVVEAPAKPPPVKPPAPPTAEAVPPAQPEKAGNIRLEKYSEDVQPIIKEWADAHPDEVQKARRGTRSDAQVRADAEKLVVEVGGDLDKARKAWKPGKAWNAEELVAIRGVLNQKTQVVLNAQKTAREDNSTKNLLKLELALKEQAVIQNEVHGLTAEAGRALRSFRQDALDALASNDAAKMEALLKKLGGRENTEKIAEMLSKIDINDPIAVNRFIQSLSKPTLMDYLTELFYNSILSGPKTHIVNSLSNTANAIFSPLERTVSALVEFPLAKIQGRERQRFLSEVPADVFGAVRGLPEGFRQFAYVLKNGISAEQATKWEFRQKAFKGKLGAVIGMPSRFLEGADVLMKSVNQRAALNAEAHRIASMEKLKGQAFEDRVAELLSTPTEGMLSNANRIAEYRLFRQEPGKFGQTLMNLRESVDIKGIRPLRFVMPFLRTPINLVKYGLERTPLGFLNPKLWQNVAQKNPQAADQLAAAMIGSIGMASMATYFAAGMITGAPPRDRAERERFYREGKQPFALRVGDFWVSYQRLEPFNQLLGQVAIIVDAIDNNDKGVDEKIKDALGTFSQNFVSQTYMSSLSDLVEMLAEPERYAGRWLNKFASSMVIPMSSATRTAAQMLDRTVRDPRTAMETIEANIPGLSTRVKSKITSLGEDVVRKSPPWFPINVTPVEETVLSQELERLKFDIGFTGKVIGGIELSEAEQRDYQLTSGQLIKKDLEKLMLAPEYWQASDVDREKMLRKTITAARDWARMKTQEKIWTTGGTEERMAKLETALRDTDAQLGKVISETPTFTHEPPNIYDVKGELDSSYRSLLKNISEDTLKGMKVPPSVSSWYAKEKARITSSALPSKPLIQLNADKVKGTTYEDYAQQWQERTRITDERELADFDKKYPNASLGNISRRHMAELKAYFALDKAGREKYLKGLSEEDRTALTSNSYTDWLKSNPKDNAQLAFWGEAKILTKAAYNEYKRLMNKVDVVDSALPKLTLPPESSIDTHFGYVEMVAEGKHASWEAQLLLAKDAEAAKKAGVQSYAEWRTKEGQELQVSETPIAALELKVKNRELFDEMDTLEGDAVTKFKADHLEFVADMRRIEAIENDGEQFQEDWVSRGKVVDEFGGGSSEAKVFFLDNPEVHKWALDKGIVVDDGTDWNEQVLRMNTKLRKQDKEYDTIEDKTAYLQDNPDYRKDRRRREAYQINLDKQYVETYVEHYDFPDKGMERELHFAENPAFERALWIAKNPKVDPTKYKSSITKHIESLRISVKYKDKDAKYDESMPAERERILVKDKEYAKARYMRMGYDYKFPDAIVPQFAEYMMIPEKGWTKERYLKDNRKLYNYAQSILGWDDIDFTKVPSENFERQWDWYQGLPLGESRKQFRRSNAWFDQEGIRLGYWNNPVSGEEKMTAADKWLKEAAERIAAIKVR